MDGALQSSSSGGSKRPVTIVDVAARARVSKSTVSNVLRGVPVRPALRARVTRAIEELGYRPSAVAQGLARQRTRTLGVVVPRLSNPFYAEILSGLEHEAQTRGYRLLIASADNHSHTEGDVINALSHYRPAGYVLSGMGDAEAAEALAALGVPLVLLDSHDVPAVAGQVMIDDFLGMQLAVRHLVELGHRRIAAVIDTDVDPGRYRRLAGYVNALEQAGIEPDDQLRVPDRTPPGSREPAPRPAVVDQLLGLENRPTAVVAADDLAAIGLMDSFEARGVRVPNDISIVGFDDIAIARVARISLTTVRQPALAMGESAAAALIDHLEGASTEPLSSIRHLIEPELIIRRTTGRARL